MEQDSGTIDSSTTGVQLPQSRVRLIMKTTPDLLNVSPEALFAVSKAAELFIETLVFETFKRTKKGSIVYSDLADYVLANEELEYLHEMIPRKVKYSEMCNWLRLCFFRLTAGRRAMACLSRLFSIVPDQLSSEESPSSNKMPPPMTTSTPRIGSNSMTTPTARVGSNSVATPTPRTGSNSTATPTPRIGSGPTATPTPRIGSGSTATPTPRISSGSMTAPTPRITVESRLGRVLGLVDPIYEAGFAMRSPSQPPLSGRTMHTLYAVSFITYSSNCFCDWVHVFCTLRGHVTSFPLRTWLVTAMVICVVAGSMLTALLLVLCVENAFAHRLNIVPYRSGLAVVCEALIAWLQAFNNFRLSFLVLLLHDAPMSMINFFFIAACRCAGPHVWQWPLMLSVSSTTVSVCWRIAMLYFAYRPMLCPGKWAKSATSITINQPSMCEQFNMATMSSGGEGLDEMDECWPVRWSRYRILGGDRQQIEQGRQKEDEEEEDQNENRPATPCLHCEDDDRNGEEEEEEEEEGENGRRWRRSTTNRITFKLKQMRRCLMNALRYVMVTFLSMLIYLGYCLMCCLPCIHYYFCLPNSLKRRHKFANSCVKNTSTIFHFSMFCFSLCLTILILSLNLILLVSVHGIGNARIPPEINQVCIIVHREEHRINALLRPQALIGDVHNDKFFNNEMEQCKPIWENPNRFGLGLSRIEAGTWQARMLISSNLLIISTRLRSNFTDRLRPFHQLEYDYALLHRMAPSSTSTPCIHGNATFWRFESDTEHLQWPYFSACDNSVELKWTKMFECN